MISSITRKFRRDVRSGLAPLAAIVLITACSVCYFIPMWKTQPTWEGLPQAAVRRISFDDFETASGVVQCPQQTVVKCQLENLQIRKRGGAFLAGGASTILEIIPNGTTVKKGDVLCRLDASVYEDVALAQTIRVEQHKAEEVQRDTGLQSAELALKEYRDGLFAQGTMHGVKVGGSMGLTTWAAFSGGNAHAIVDGDFIMTAAEVQPVLHALRKADIHIVALHNHMVGEQPAYYFTHFWGKGPALELARGIRSALDAQKMVRAEGH